MRRPLKPSSIGSNPIRAAKVISCSSLRWCVTLEEAQDITARTWEMKIVGTTEDATQTGLVGEQGYDDRVVA